MLQYQPKANTYYRIQNVAYGYYLSLNVVRDGVAPVLLAAQETRRQYWKFVVDPSAKNTYKVVNAAPNVDDVDTHYALHVLSPSHSVVTRDADAKPAIWRINISDDRDHCSFITSYRDMPDSRPHLQGNPNGTVNLAEDDHKGNQRWRLVAVGARQPTPPPDPTHPHPHPPAPAPNKLQLKLQLVPKRIDEIEDGHYTLINVHNEFTPLFTSEGQAGVTRDHQNKPPLIFRYQKSTSPYFTMKIYGTDMYVQEFDGYLKGTVTSTPTLWYLVKSPAPDHGITSFYVCPKGTGKVRAWNGRTIEKHGVGDVLDNVAELPQDGRNDDAWRWWIWPSIYPNLGRFY